MRLILALTLCLPLFAADKPVPAGPLKAFRGPEGEVIGMVEVNGSKEMLVHFKNIGGEMEGQSRLYFFEDHGSGKKGVYFNKKKGSKTERYYILSARNGHWEFYNPARPSEIKIAYSEKETEKMKLEDVLKAYKP